MKLSRSIRKAGRTVTYVPGHVAYSGKFSLPANEPPAGGAPAGGTGSGTEGDPKPEAGADKTFTQADLSRVGAKEKAEGKAAAEKAIAEQFGCTIEEAKAIITKAREAEDKTKSEAQKDREKAQQELTAAEKAKQDAAAEMHTARIERALAKLGFTGKDEDAARVYPMVTVKVGSTYEEVLADVTEVKKSLNPSLFGEQGTGGKGGTGRGLPNGDPKGAPTKPTGGEDAYTRGENRYAERAKAKRGYNPFAKQTE